jgi:hypothetical protein
VRREPRGVDSIIDGNGCRGRATRDRRWLLRCDVFGDDRLGIEADFTGERMQESTEEHPRRQACVLIPLDRVEDPNLDSRTRRNLRQRQAHVIARAPQPLPYV